jgi:Uma2 family endonuclease
MAKRKGMGARDYIPNYTYDDYAQWEGDWELYEGVPVAMAPAPSLEHQGIAGMMIAVLNDAIEECETCLVVGEADYRLDDETVFRPDIALICQEEKGAYIKEAPEMVVEIVSSSTVKRDEGYKFSRYEAAGVKYYLLVYPETLQADVFLLEDGHYVKVGTFSTETYRFKETSCEVAIDFDRVFRRFRK